MQKVKRKVDFTQGRVFLKIVWFILPIMVTNLLQMFYNAADMMVVSMSHEPNAKGAIGLTGAFIHLVINVFIGFSVGANVVVSREIGAKNKENAQKAVHTSLMMAVIFGVIGGAIGLLVARPVLQYMGAEGSLLNLAVTYTAIYFACVPFLALANYLIAIFRAKGDAKTPLIVLSLTGLLNVGLNFFFVLVVGWSVEGVALATAIANVASAIILLVKLHKDQDYTTFSWEKLKLDKQAFQDIVKNGLPAGIQGALFSLSNVIIQSSIVTVNNAMCPPDRVFDPIVNGSAAAGNIEGFVYTAMNAVYQGAITVSSQNMGAGKPQRIKRIMYSCFLITSIIGISLSAFVLLLEKPLLSLYGVTDGVEGSLKALEMYAAQTRFRYILTFYFLDGIMEVTFGILRGIGKSFISMVISLAGVCVFRMIWIGTLFPISQTLGTVFISYPITWIVTLLVGFVFIQVLLKKILNEQALKEKSVEV